MTRPVRGLSEARQRLARLATVLAVRVVERGLVARHLPGDVTVGAGVFGAERAEFAGANDIGAWSSFGRRVSLGYATTIGVSSVLLGPARIGDFCQLGPHVLVYGQDHPVDRFSTYTGKHLLRRELAAYRSESEIEIGHGVWVGCNATILRGTTIGNGAVIGAGSVVRGDIAPYSIAAGNPARVIRPRIDPELAVLVDESRWWTLRGDEQVVLQELSRVDFRQEPERAREALLELLARRVEH